MGWRSSTQSQRLAVAVDERLELRVRPARDAGSSLGGSWWRSSLAHSIGTSVSDTTAEMRIVTESVIANSWNSRPTTSPMNSSGISTAISETVSEMMVKPISPEPLQRRLQRRHALLDVARDVLDHDDRVVDHEAGGDGERHQRQVVQAEAEQVHHRERADERQRHRQARDDGGRDAAQEQEDHQHHQDHGERRARTRRRAPRRGWCWCGR